MTTALVLFAVFLTAAVLCLALQSWPTPTGKVAALLAALAVVALFFWR